MYHIIHWVTRNLPEPQFPFAKLESGASWFLTPSVTHLPGCLSQPARTEAVLNCVCRGAGLGWGSVSILQTKEEAGDTSQSKGGEKDLLPIK